MKGDTETRLPASSLSRATLSCSPTPLPRAIEAAWRAETWSASATSECPPGLKEVNCTSSSRKSVCFAITVTPLDSVQRTASIASTCSSSTMLPGVGMDASSGTSPTVSAYASTASASAFSS